VLDVEDLAGKASGGPVSLCRCYKSSTFPMCDGSHVAHNKDTGDNAGPCVLKCGLPPEQRGLRVKAETNAEEKERAVPGPRANNYGLPSTMPPDAPSRRVDVLAMEDVAARVAEKGEVKLCRCFKSSTFPLCDGSHNAHNAATGDNAGPLVVKSTDIGLSSPKAKSSKRANHYSMPSTMPPDKPTRRVDVLDVEDLAGKASGGPVSLCRCYKSSTFPMCDGSHVAHNKDTGDNAGPCVLKCGLPPEQQLLEPRATMSQEEKDRSVVGPRANNYGLPSTMPPHEPTRRVDVVSMEAVEERVAEKGVLSMCRCFKSATFPYCDGSHNAHNAATGDNAGPLVIKAVGEDAAPAPTRTSGKEGDETPLRSISLMEVARHNTEGDFWTVIHGKVYDLTDFLPEHPGGMAVMKQYGGKVADDGFDPIHPESIITENIPKEKLLGEVPAHELDGVVTEEEVSRPPLERCLNLYDFEEVARRTMKSTSWAYYCTGDKDELTKNGNQLIFRRIKLAPRVMVDVSETSLSCNLLGAASSLPIYISGSAKGGLAHPDAEVALSRAAASKGIVQMAPHMGSKPLSEIAAARLPGQTHWLQLYVEKDRGASEATVREAQALGFEALFLTVDSAGLGKRETDLRATPGGTAPRSVMTKRRWADDLTWEDVPWFRSITTMRLVLKGVQSGADAVLAYQHGLDGIVVSNHGGRNLDTARPSLEVLVEVMAALREKKYDPAKFEVFLDGGIKRGADVYKAIALGAKAVGIGRAALFGLAAYGQPGVEATLDILHDELDNTCRLMGTPSLATITSKNLVGVDRALETVPWDGERPGDLTTVEFT